MTEIEDELFSVTSLSSMTTGLRYLGRSEPWRDARYSHQDPTGAPPADGSAKPGGCCATPDACRRGPAFRSRSAGSELTDRAERTADRSHEGADRRRAARIAIAAAIAPLI